MSSQESARLAGSTFTKLSYANTRGVMIQSNALLKIILVNQFICDFVYACQCIWLFSLFSIYRPSRVIDAFIWVVPLMFANLVKPYLVRYSKTIPSLLKVIIFSYISIVFGQYLVVVSTEPQRLVQTHELSIQYKRFRILIAFIGWMLIKVSLQNIYNLNDQLSAIIIYNNLDYDVSEIDKISLIGQVNALLLCGVALIKVFTYRNYYRSMSEIYYVCSLLCLTGAALMYSYNNFKPSRNIPNQSLKLKQENTSKQYDRSIEKIIKDTFIQVKKWINQFRSKEGSLKYDYFRGFSKIWESSIDMKLYLLMTGFAKIIVLSIRFFSSMWIVQSLGKTHIIKDYKMGLQIGCIMLCIFYSSTYFLRKYIDSYFRFSKESKFKRMIYQIVFILVSMLVGICCFVSIQTNNTALICLSIFLCSVLVSNIQVFIQNDQQSINRFHPEFQICQNATFRIANFVSFLAGPVYVNFVDQTNSKIKALTTIVYITVVVVLLKTYFLTKIQKKEKKEDLRDQETSKNQISQNVSMISSTRSSNKQSMSGKNIYSKGLPSGFMQTSLRQISKAN